ncbi:MAG: hypothetical protein ACRDWV_07565 [Acidimicrobiales bacterium]
MPSELGNRLERAVLAVRRTSEAESRRSFDELGVCVQDKPAHLDTERPRLRNALRTRWRQLGEAGPGGAATMSWHPGPL